MSAFFASLRETELARERAKEALGTPSISVFPKGLWRIDWIGDLAFPDRTIRRKQCSVFVHLSRLTSESVLKEPHLLLYADCTYRTEFQKKVWVSVGALSLLRVGDIWRNGTLEDQPEYEQETFADVQVDSSSCQLIKAGLKQDDSYLLPLAEHPWHLNCTRSYCVVVTLNEERRIIIPCMELIRFYFGSSSELISRLFLPDFTREFLYSKASFHSPSGHLNLELAEGISGASAADIGRISQDRHAWYAAARISKSVLTASVTKQLIYPQTLFPFHGKTTLMASGKWLSFANKPRSTFLVYRLKSCSHPFPFQGLKYETKSVRLRSYAPTSATDKAHARILSSKKNGARTLVEQDASCTLSPERRLVPTQPRFPDLLPKYVWKSPSLSTTTVSHTKSVEIDQVAVGEGGSERRVRAIDLLILQSQPGRPQLPSFLKVLVEEALLIKGIDTKVLTSSDEDGWTVPVSLLADEEGEIDSRLFFEIASGISTLRRACVLAFREANAKCLLVIIEASPPHISVHSPASDSEDALRDVLVRATTAFLCNPVSKKMVLSEQIALAFQDISNESMLCATEHLTT